MDCFSAMKSLCHPQDEDVEEGVQSHLDNCPRCKAAKYKMGEDRNYQFSFQELANEQSLVANS